MSLADYLAKNYLTADTIHSSERPKKKRKKNKHAEDPTTENDGLIIADDDPPDLRSSNVAPRSSRPGFSRRDDDEDEGPTAIGSATIVGSTRELKKTKSNWQTVAGPSAPSNAEQVAADAILASAAEERSARTAEEEDTPMIVDDGAGVQDSGLRMESGARAGLQTAAQTAAMVEAQALKLAREAKAMRRDRKSGKDAEAETIYRDASGRIINVAMKRAEARKAAEEAVAKEAAEKEALTGDVQRKAREERRKAVEDARYIPLARTADDEEMNEELKARERWNDPAAQFLTKSSTTGGVSGGKKTYKGAAPPNRYGIRPGHRWDGVDRSNGFERQWFDARNKRERNEGLAYEWQMDE